MECANALRFDGLPEPVAKRQQLIINMQTTVITIK